MLLVLVVAVSLFDQKAREGRFVPGIHEAVTVVMRNGNGVTDFQLQKTTSGHMTIAAIIISGKHPPSVQGDLEASAVSGHVSVHDEEVVAVDGSGEDAGGGVVGGGCVGDDAVERNDGTFRGDDVRFVRDVGGEGHGPVVVC